MRHIETLKRILESLRGRRVLSTVSTAYVIEVLETILAEYEAEPKVCQCKEKYISEKSYCTVCGKNIYEKPKPDDSPFQIPDFLTEKAKP